MNTEQIKARLQAVLSVLDKMSVTGFDNQRRLIGCADYLSETINMLDSQLVPLDEEKNHDASK